MSDRNPAHAIKVSVIIPAYNQAHYLDEAIKSVFAQTYQDYEIVVVNDGSTDDTETVAQRYGERIRYVAQENRGLAGARNTGVREARGELVALLDSDDLWLPRYLETMVSLADEHSQADVFFCAARCMDQEGRDLSQVVGYQEVEPGNLYKTLLRSNFIIPSTVTARRSTIQQAGYFDQTLRSCEDWELWLRLLPAGSTFRGVATVLARYRIHGSSLSTNVAKMQSSYRSVVEKHFGEDDGCYQQWREEKRAAFGGFYRYQLMTNIQRQNNWKGAETLRKAIWADPETSSDVDFYYELALGSQPVGYRGTGSQLHLVENAKNLENLLSDLFALADNSTIQAQRRRIYGTAYKAFGLAAYNTGQFSLCRKYLWQAVRQQPGLLREKWITDRFLKSFLGKSGLLTLRSIRRGRMSGLKE